MAAQKRRPSQDQFVRHRMRYKFICRLREQARYRNVVNQDVRPLWQKLSTCNPGLLTRVQQFRSLASLPSLAKDGEVELDDVTREGLIEYISAVKGAAQSLGLTWNGKPAEWVLEYIHADAANQLDPASEVAVNPIHDIHLSVSVTANGASIVVTGDSTGSFRATVTEDTEFPWRQDITDASGIAFAEWDHVRDAVYNVLTGWIESARNKMLDHYDLRNPSALDRQFEIADRLFDHVVGGKTVRDVFPGDVNSDDTRRRRLRRIADFVQLDLPR